VDLQNDQRQIGYNQGRKFNRGGSMKLPTGGTFWCNWCNVVLVAVTLFGLIAQAEAKMDVKKQAWGKTADGKQIDLYVLTNDKGFEVKVTNFGAAVVSIMAPDRQGKMADVILGYDSAAGYQNDTAYLGTAIGRYGNRIGGAQFSLDDKVYKLAKNDGANSLHGGAKGFNKVLWTAEEVRDKDGVGVRLRYLSKDGEEGYPGNLSATITYTVTNANELKMHYQATTDKPTVANLTNHAYFNLLGDAAGDILGHELMINADKYLPVDKGLIPTGELRSVKGTPLDFTKPTAVGARINDKDEQMVLGGGYDHCWVLNKKGLEMSLAARMYEPKTGRVMEVTTTEPAIQFYTGNFLNGTIKGKKGTVYQKRMAFCLETEHYPDSPNKPSFPTTVVKPGETYSTTTVYKFSAK